MRWAAVAAKLLDEGSDPDDETIEHPLRHLC
jgi:hypothetical protein